VRRDQIDHQVGIEVLAKVGDQVKPGQNLVNVHARCDKGLEIANKLEESAFVLSDEPVIPGTLILDTF